MKKTILALILILALTVAAGQALATHAEPISNAPAGEIAPFYLLINSAIPSLSVSGTTATYSLIVECQTTVKSINATLQIQKLTGSTYVDYGLSLC